VKKQVTLLGATGSIGKQTVALIEAYPEQFELTAISAYRSIDTVLSIMKHHPIKAVAMPKAYESDIRALDASVSFHALEDDGLVTLTHDATDLFINALVGSVGLKPTLTAIDNKQDVLLANKESLVVGGPLIKEAQRKSGARIIPIDSEHAAIRACLKGRDPDSIDRIVITASGGSLREVALDTLDDVTVEDVLKHPNWKMGAKITVDSATMMNKVFEVIEAHYLFDVPYERIDAVLHKESVVHAMVHFKDGNVLSHMGPADMKIPILSAMQDSETLRYHSLFSLENLNRLHFSRMESERYPLFDLGIAVAKNNGMHVVTLNAANEVAVALFLKKKIGFNDIKTLITQCLDYFDNKEKLTLENVLNHDKSVRDYAYKLFN